MRYEHLVLRALAMILRLMLSHRDAGFPPEDIHDTRALIADLTNAPNA